MARREIEIDWKKVERMAEARASAEVISDYLNIGLSTFYARFTTKYGTNFQNYRHRFLERANNNILLKQYEKAMGGSIQMLQWLGREWLNQGKIDTTTPPNQIHIDSESEIRILKGRIMELESNGNGGQPQAD